MACVDCRARATLVARLAPEIERIGALDRQSLLGLLALDGHGTPPRGRGRRHPRDAAPCTALSAAQTVSPAAQALPTPSDAPATRPAATAVCQHDPAYPDTLSQLPSAPAVLHATCDPARLMELLGAPAVALIGRRHPTDYPREVAFALARDLAAARLP
jgi:DNA processing protein